jgi:GNAT superfamily N-acetyltransferase
VIEPQPSSIAIRDFTEDLIPQAAGLLAARQAQLRARDPALPARLVSPEAARHSLTSLWTSPQARGAAAMDGSRLLAYMIGTQKAEPIWGPNAWVHGPGLALGHDADPAVIADLYAAIGAPWVNEGVFYHFTMVPAAEAEVVRAWFALAFGIEQIHGVADLSAVEPPPPLPAGMTIRRAGPRDGGTLAGFSELIWRELLAAPVWAITLPEMVAEIRAGYAELAGDPTATVWMAEVDRRVVAIQGYWEHDHPDPVLVPEKAVTVSVVATLPEERGKGYQTALTHHGLWQARQAGYEYCETDWRGANRGIARMLPQLGFRTIAYRLVRRVDARIAGAARLND